MNILFHRTASQVQSELAVKPRDPGPVRCRTQTKSTLRDAELWQGSLARPAWPRRSLRNAHQQLLGNRITLTA